MVQSSNAGNKFAYGCLAVFAVPFAAIGTFMAYLTINTIVQSVNMSAWPQVPAELKSVELKGSSGKSKTAWVAAEYTYEFQGKSYTGSKASLYSADNVGSFHEDLYHELNDAKSKGESIAVHVNPDDPAQSIIRPDLRWGMLSFYMVFVIAFGTVGWGLLLAAIFSVRQDKVRRALQAQHPTEPWLWNPKWKARKIPSNQKAQAIILGVIALVWNAISLPVLTVLPREIERKNYAILFLLIFPIIGAALLYFGGQAVLRWKRFKKVWLELQTLPARPGASLRGVIHPGVRLEGIKTMAAEFVCERSERVHRSSSSNSKSKSSIETSRIWQSKVDIPPSRISTAMDESPIQIDVPVPSDARDCCELVKGSYGIAWKLIVHAELAGPDFKAEFDIPVFSGT